MEYLRITKLNERHCKSCWKYSTILEDFGRWCKVLEAVSIILGVWRRLRKSWPKRSWYILQVLVRLWRRSRQKRDGIEILYQHEESRISYSALNSIAFKHWSHMEKIQEFLVDQTDLSSLLRGMKHSCLQSSSATTKTTFTAAVPILVFRWRISCCKYLPSKCGWVQWVRCRLNVTNMKLWGIFLSTNLTGLEHILCNVLFLSFKSSLTR